MGFVMNLKTGLLSALQMVVVISVARRTLGQSLGDDAACLMGFKAGIKDNAAKLAEWTNAKMANPCNDSIGPSLEGITCDNQRVVAISLIGRKLGGVIPESLINCTLLQLLELSANRISGTIPSIVADLSYLTTLNLSNNLLTGAIPVELSECIYLNVVDLHQNQLSGQIPGQLGALTRLRVFDISDNSLSGEIPSSLASEPSGAPRFNASSFLGNKDLYGYPLSASAQSHSLPVLAIVGIGLGSGLVSLIVSFSAVCIWLRVTEHGYAAEEGKISQLNTNPDASRHSS